MRYYKSNRKLDEYEALRNSGWTYQQIADKYGVSRQSVSEIMAKYKRSAFQGFNEKRCVYVGLRNWLNENRCSLKELHRRMYGHNSGGNSKDRYKRLLRGEGLFNKNDIDSLISVTGLTYEELFRREESL